MGCTFATNKSKSLIKKKKNELVSVSDVIVLPVAVDVCDIKSGELGAKIRPKPCVQGIFPESEVGFPNFRRVLNAT